MPMSPVAAALSRLKDSVQAIEKLTPETDADVIWRVYVEYNSICAALATALSAAYEKARNRD